MSKIIFEGMKFKSFIGIHDFEQTHGNRFEVHLSVENILPVSENDSIHETLDYSELYAICRTVMAGRYQLIETAAQHIIIAIRKIIGSDSEITVRICKLHPPLGGEVEKVCIEVKG